MRCYLSNLAASLTVFSIALAAYGLSASEAEPSKELAAATARQEALEKDVTQGALRVVKPDGQVVECPLKHTDVKADISGFIARVKVTQTFRNPTNEKIEAVYVFPLPHEAAVDDMTMVVGDRKIVGLIKRRAEARAIYQQALAAGNAAALLEQERPNIFTQSVGNIGPGEEVKIEISYVDVLRYDLDTYEFHFPMVVGPRYNPGAPIASPSDTPPELQGKVSPPQPDTNIVPDASRISPPVMKPGYRSGDDISLAVSLQAGVPIRDLKSTNHKADIAQDKNTQAEIKLTADESNMLRNKDFVLRYSVLGDKPEMALLANTGRYSGDAKALGDGYFLLMIQPKEDERLTKSPPREIVFLIDVSGSMSGQPIAKASECMREMARLCRAEKDTLQVITFASGTNKLFEKPMPVNDDNLTKALAFGQNMRGGGGTEMLKGVKAAIDDPLDKDRVRIVVMLTDGYIGNEAQIIEHVGKNCGDQVLFWCVGMGQAPNMFLVDGVAKQGGGMGKKLGLNDDTNTMAQEVMTRIQRAQLAKIKIDWAGLDVAETYPAKIPELWAGRPVILYGRYRGPGEAEIKIAGMLEGEPVSWPLKVTLPQQSAQHEVLSKVWARQKIEDLMQQSFYAGSPEVEEMVTALALDYKLMSQYTSFVAVDAKNATETNEPAKPPRRMLVPVPLPEGTQWEGFFGGQSTVRGEEESDRLALGLKLNLKQPAADASGAYAYGRGMSGGRFGGSGGGGALDGKQRGRDFLARGAVVKRLPMQTGAAMPTTVAPSGGVPGRPSLLTLSRRQNLPASAATREMARGFSMAGKPVSGLNVGIHQLAAGDRADGPAELPAIGSKEALTIVGANATQQALQPEAQAIAKTAGETLQKAKDAQKDGQLAKARELFIQACLLDQAAANFGASGGQTATEALAALESVQADQVKEWSKTLPGLTKKLDLVIRDRSLEQALQDVAKAAGLKIDLLAGSIDDAKSLSGDATLRVNYLDLRGATVAQALDWLLQPERMTWRVETDGVVAGTDRRRAGTTAWVYDVSLIALPEIASPEKPEDWQKSIAAAKKEAQDFGSLLRTVLGIKADDPAVAWFAPGQLILIRNQDQHAKAAKLFADLADPKFRLTGELAGLQKITAPRAEKRQADVKRQAELATKLRTAQAHEAFGWQLLAAAAGGKLDLEALTELHIAWKQPQTTGMLSGNGRALALRSLWIVNEAARALPNEAELTSLAKSAQGQCEAAITESLAALEKTPADADAFSAVLYAALATRDDGKSVAKSLAILAKTTGDDDSLAAARAIAHALLVDPQQIDREKLSKLVEQGVAGEDSTVLLAMACHRAGGDVWSAFRAVAGDLVGDQPLSGDVVVLINRLSQRHLPLTVAVK